MPELRQPVHTRSNHRWKTLTIAHHFVFAQDGWLTVTKRHRSTEMQFASNDFPLMATFPPPNACSAALRR